MSFLRRDLNKLSEAPLPMPGLLFWMWLLFDSLESD